MFNQSKLSGMRKFLLFLSITALMLFSCNAIKEAITVPINTTLSVDVPLSVTATKSASLNYKAGTVNYFTANKVLQVADNVDMNAYVNKIKSVDLTKVSISITPLTDPDEVLTLDVSVSGVTGPVFSKTNITATANNPFTVPITPAIQAQLDLVAAKLIADRQLTITLSGTTNVAAGRVLSAKLAFDAKFVCMPLN